MQTVSAPVPTAEAEIGHVLFTQIVGWAEFGKGQQAASQSMLEAAIAAAPDYVAALAEGNVTLLPTDGAAAVVFQKHPGGLAGLAESIWRVAAQQNFSVRMGMHSGTISRLQDIDMRLNVAGVGINVAQRLLDSALPGEILVSEAVYELLESVPGRKKDLHALGLFECKPDQWCQLYSLAGDGYGVRRKVPLVAERTEIGPAEKRHATAPQPPAAPRKVVMVYKRNCEPDGYVLWLLEQQLTQLGHQVFVDRHVTVSLGWGRQINKWIEEADAVIPLISQGSIASEFMLEEVKTAIRVAKERGGLPRVVPVRVGYAGKVPDELGALLNPIQYVLWEEQGDNVKLISDIAKALQIDPSVAPPEIVSKPPRETSMPYGSSRERRPNELDARREISIPSVSSSAVGGAEPLDSPFYIERRCDPLFHAAIQGKDSIVLAKAARQMGKTSLLARGIAQARANGWKVAVTDFQKLSMRDLESTETLLMALATSIADSLELGVYPEDHWRPGSGPNMNFERFLRNQVLKQVDTHLVWALDEVDRLMTTKFGSEIFGLFRSWHNERALNPEGPWRKLTQAFCYATEAHLFIADLNQSPFNVGTHLTLEDFTLTEVKELNELYGRPVRDDFELSKLYGLVGGHPFLVRKSLHRMATAPMRLREFELEAPKDDGPVGDNLKRILYLLALDPKLTDDLREILRGRPCPDPHSFYRLRSAGIISGDSAAEARPRCSLYEQFLSRHLLTSS